MSFILDALKKLEQKKHSSSSPTLLTIHRFQTTKAKKRPLWFYVLVAALLLNAVILLTWLSPWKSEKTVIAKQSIHVESRKSTTTESGKEVFNVPAPIPSPHGDIAETKTGKPQGETLSNKNTIRTAPAITPEVKQPDVEPKRQPLQSGTENAKKDMHVLPPDTRKEHTITPSAEGKTAVIYKPAANQVPDVNVTGISDQIPERDALPSSVQQELPDINVSGHIFSNERSSRIVNINGQILREGETVTAGLKLEEITESGVVLSYKGYHFRMRGF